MAAGGVGAAARADAARRGADKRAVQRRRCAGADSSVPPRLQEAGWSVGRNLRIDIRWGGGDNARARHYAEELVALNPDVILAGTGATVQPLQQASRTVPIVFAQQIDPVGAGNVETLARPNSNVTGFLQFEFSLAGKWLELLREVAPELKRVGVIRDPGAPQASGSGLSYRRRRSRWASS